MFDNPLAYPSPPPAPKFSPRAVAGFCAVAIAVAAAAGHAFTPGQARDVSSPTHLREVEIFASPAQTVFYLHNAGYRLLHKRQLIAIVSGGGDLSVTWPGPNAVRITCEKPWARLIRGQPQGITFAITAPAPARPAP